MHHRHRLLAAAGAAILIAGSNAGLALAQDRPPLDGSRQRFEVRHAQRAQALHDALQLRPEQEAAWREFQATLAPPPGHRAERPDHDARAGLTTPQRLDLMGRRLAERQARFQKVSDATRRFYAVLSAQQQKAFDSMTARGDGFGRRGHGRGGHGRGAPDDR